MPFGFGAIFGITIAITIFTVVVMLLAVVGLVYIGLRVQDSRQSTPDPKIGLKLAFHTVHTTAILIGLLGASVFMYDLMEGAVGPGRNQPNFGGQPVQFRDDGLNDTKRTALALIGSAALFGVIFWAFLMGTNDSEQRSVRRVFVGGRMALCLLITMFTVTGLITNLALKTSNTEATETFVALLLVWFPAGIVHMLLFFNNVNRKVSRRVTDDDEDRPWRPER